MVLVLVAVLTFVFAAAAGTDGRPRADNPPVPVDLRGYPWWWSFESTPRGWERWDGPFPAQDVCERLTDDYRQQYPRRTFECRM